MPHKEIDPAAASDIIRQLSTNNIDELVSGATIIAKAKEAVKEAKKMHCILRTTAVKECVIDKVEGGEYSLPSGKSKDNFDR